MRGFYKFPLLLDPQPEGGWTITSPALPGLVTEADTLDEVFINVRNAFAAVLEAYEEVGLPLPANLGQQTGDGSIWFEHLVAID